MTPGHTCYFIALCYVARIHPVPTRGSQSCADCFVVQIISNTKLFFLVVYLFRLTFDMSLLLV